MARGLRYRTVYGVGALLLTLILFAVLLATTEWFWYLNWLLACSVVTFLLYGWDKALAKAGTGRVPETILHLFALLGGFIGGWLGMVVFRHKTNFRRHPLFPIVLLVSTALHLALIYFLFVRN